MINSLYYNWLAADDRNAFIAEGLSALPPKEVQIFHERLESECKAVRKEAYDQLNQDELRFDDLTNGTTLWTDAISAIKTKYPKEVTNG